MRPVEIRPGFGRETAPRRDLVATLVVAVLLVAIVVTGFAALLLKAGGAA